MTDRKNILEKLAVNEDLEEGRIGTISLNKSKVERWKREIADGAALSYGSPTFRVKGKKDFFLLNFHKIHYVR